MSRNGAHERSGPMNDPVDVVRHVAPAVEPPSALLERVRSDLMTTITESDPIPARRPSRRRRRWAVPIAAAAVLATAAAGWAAVRHDSSTNTAIGCPHRDRGGNSTFIAAVTGDPVVDCGNAWRDMFGTEPPPMTAYDTGSGGVVVLLDGEPVPDGYTRLAPGPHVDTTLIQLQAALDDSGSGLTSNCFDEPGARNVVERELDRLGLDDWTVTVDESRPPTGAASCAYFVVDAEQQEVQLIGMGPAPSTPSRTPPRPAPEPTSTSAVPSKSHCEAPPPDDPDRCASTEGTRTTRTVRMTGAWDGSSRDVRPAAYGHRT